MQYFKPRNKKGEVKKERRKDRQGDESERNEKVE
jgi:hypothetical protein